MRCFLIFFCVACSSPSAPPTPPPEAAGVDAPLALVRASLGDAPRLQPGELRVRRGQRVELKLEHTGVTMDHSLDLLAPVDVTPRRTVESFGVLKPGGSLKMMFDAPQQPGRYPIQCGSTAYTTGPCGVLLVE